MTAAGGASLALLCATAFVAAFIGVVTGGNSLLTVPVMLWLGMDPHRAIADNMFAVTFLAASGGVRFARGPVRTRWDLVAWLALPTLLTSLVGARLVVALPERTVRAVVAAAMLLMVGVLVTRPKFGNQPARSVSRERFALGLGVASLLGIYGGLFSGGYTTLLTFTCVSLLGASLVESVGLTKWVNTISSGIATLEFWRRGLIDLPIALPMAAAMAIGAWLGAKVALGRGERFIRALFVVGVALLAGKLLVWDLLLAY